MINELKMYFHCKKCGGGNHAVGWTKKGIQVWCEICDLGIIHLDFKGQKVAYAVDEDESN